MGRMLGSFADDQELDRPDLNKCPDCDCFFASDACPLCKKVCPEEMRAGNRKPVKQKKHKRRSGSGRVTFISWYHRWWFIILMLLVFPLAGIILLITSPHETWKKWLVVAIGVIYMLVSTIGIGSIISAVTDVFDPPVNTHLTRQEYEQKCQEISAEQYYREHGSYRDAYVCVELKVVETAAYTDQNDYFNHDTYYICAPANDTATYYVIVRDCLVDTELSLIPGDVIVVYGQGDELCYAYNAAYVTYQAPCLNMAYCVYESQK